MKTTLIKKLAALGACEDALQWLADNKIRSASAAWLKCPQPDWMLWALEATGRKPREKKMRLFACWCARNTPLEDGRMSWDLLTDERSRAAVEVAERFARGKATQEELSAAESAAWSAVQSAAESARSAAWSAARSAAWSAARSAARSAAESAAWSAAWSAAESAAWSAARSAAWSAAWSAQADALRKIYGNPFKAKRKAAL